MFVKQINISRKDTLFIENEGSILTRRLKYPETIDMSRAVRDSYLYEEILTYKDPKEIAKKIEKLFQIEPPSDICPRWISRSYFNENKFQPGREPLNNFCFRNRNSYCAICTLRDRLVNYYPSRYSPITEIPENLQNTLQDCLDTSTRWYELTVPYIQTISKIDIEFEPESGSDVKMKFCYVSQDLLLTIIGYIQMMNGDDTIKLIGTCSGKRFFILDGEPEDGKPDNANLSIPTLITENFFIFHKGDAIQFDTHTDAIPVIQSDDKKNISVFLAMDAYPEFDDEDYLNAFSTILYSRITNKIVKNENSDLKIMYGFLNPEWEN